MNAKRSTQTTQWIGPDDISFPAGAVLANELVFQQLAFEALALSIIRARPTPRDSDEDEERAPARWT